MWQSKEQVKILSDKLFPYQHVKKSSSAVQPKEKDAKKVGTFSKAKRLIKSTVDKATKTTKNDAKPSKMGRMFK